MSERIVPILRIICMCLGGLIVFQLSKLVVHKDPLQGVTVPATALASTASTNSTAAAKGTNSPSAEVAKKETNSPVRPESSTNKPGLAAQPEPGTSKTNSAILLATGTNKTVIPTKPGVETNATNVAQSSTAATNQIGAGRKGSPASVPGSPQRPDVAATRRPGMGGPGPGMAAATLPAPVQSRVDRIVQSEILGPVVRPLPMALLGIAGKDIFLRSPMGQTGLVREGEELGGVKVLNIGTNRVLVEHEGQKKELTIFSGFGSESLLPKANQGPQ